ncbi:uncharacterized protein EAF02_004323 [Botrytis sinoallii]|uniref:uncharacterized protein n=1 Tax=Botrytis sinoallii TaxID=1463999 RepID=UPI0019020F1C|nr:uncharacterized protein EAF02_004323 [Botrytis sinoallii]KAF7885814.1 hypothetical protein EAF02_004323 [Botrytis sinoallii]
MEYQLPKDQKILKTTETERSQRVLCRKLILNSEIMESPENLDQVNDGELIPEPTSTEIKTLDIQPIVERQDGVSSPDHCIDDAIETKTRHVTINDLPHDILMNIFDELSPCMIACLGLTCRRFYTSCKIHHPKPFSLALYVDQKCNQDLSVAFCNPLGCCQFSDKTTFTPMYSTVRSWYQDAPLQIIRKQWYPRHGKHLADLIENWQGLCHYRKTWLDIGRYPYTFFFPRYLSISVYNPTNENCKAKLALQHRYRDHFLHLPLYGDTHVLRHTRSYRRLRGVPRLALPNPHQMEPRAWFLEAKELILRDRYNHVRKSRWISHWRDYTVGKVCRDWPDQDISDIFSDWKAMIGL